MPFYRVGVVIYAFGVPATISSNKKLAEIGLVEARGNEGSIFTQADIQFTDPDVRVTYLQGEDLVDPPPTLRIARAAVEWAIHNHLDVLKVVAAKPHRKRALRDTKAAVRERNTNIEVMAVKPLHDDEMSWYVPESTQPRVRSRDEWRKRERILDLMPFFIYKRVAS